MIKTNIKEIINEVKNILSKDDELVALKSTFDNTSGFTVPFIPEVDIDGDKFYNVGFNDLDDVINFITRFMSQSKFIVPKPGFFDKSAVQIICKNIKYFYLMANFAYSITLELILLQKLNYHGDLVFFRQVPRTYVNLTVNPDRQKIAFTLYLQAGTIDYILLSISHLFDMELELNTNIILDICHLPNKTRTICDQIDNITKTNIQNLLDQI